MKNRTYDPKAHSVILGSRALTGFADEFISIDYNEDHYTLMVGSMGESTRAKSANLSARITLVLLSTSPDNDYLSALMLADRLSGNGTFPFYHKDNRGTTLNTAATAWVVKTPTQGHNKEAGTRTWVIETDELIPFVGGTDNLND